MLNQPAGPVLTSQIIGSASARATAWPGPVALSIPSPALPSCVYYTHTHTHAQAECKAIFPDRNLVEAQSLDGVKFYVNYDKLAICTGSQVGGGKLVCCRVVFVRCWVMPGSACTQLELLTP